MTQTGSFTPVATQEGGTKKTTNKCVIMVVAVVAIMLVLLVAAALAYHLYSPQPDLLVQPADNIVFKSNDQDSQIIKDMKLFIKDYESNGYSNKNINWVDCSSVNPRPSNSNAVCRFEDTWMGDNCHKEEQFGFPSGMPCLILSPNLVADWTPEVYEDLDELPEAMPHDLKEHIKDTFDQNQGQVPARLWVSCTDERERSNNTRAGNPIKFQYSPWQGFPAYYFPYKGDNQFYLPPLVGIQLSNIGNKTQTIVCRTWAKNVVPDENPLTITIRMEDE